MLSSNELGRFKPWHCDVSSTVKPQSNHSIAKPHPRQRPLLPLTIFHHSNPSKSLILYIFHVQRTQIRAKRRSINYPSSPRISITTTILQPNPTLQTRFRSFRKALPTLSSHNQRLALNDKQALSIIVKSESYSVWA